MLSYYDVTQKELCIYNVVRNQIHFRLRGPLQVPCHELFLEATIVTYYSCMRENIMIREHLLCRLA